MSNYDAKHELTRARQLKTQRLAIPLFIDADATPASVTLVSDEPGMVFCKSEGVDQITLALGAVDTAAELSAITFTAANDANGIFNVICRVGETIEKVVSVKLHRRNSSTDVTISGTTPTGVTGYITSGGDKIAANFDTGVNYASANGDYVLEFEYTV